MERREFIKQAGVGLTVGAAAAVVPAAASTGSTAIGVNVQDYGAVPDSGTTNNLTAFQNAAAAAGPGGRIFIPPSQSGYYSITGEWLLDDYPGIIIEGSGDRSMIVQAGTANAITLKSCHNAKIRNLCISGKSTSYAGIAIGTSASPAAGTSHYVTIENVFIRGMNDCGIIVYSGILCTIVNAHITNNKALPFTVTSLGTTKKGIDVENNGLNNGITIIAPIIEGMGTHGLDVDGTQGVTVIGGSIEGNGNRAGTTGNTNHANVRAFNGASTVCLHNVYLETNEDVERNVIFDGVHDCHVYGGVCSTNSDTRGQVELIGASEMCRIVGVYGNQFTLGASSKRNLIEGCTYKNVGGGSISDSGSNNEIVRNRQSNGDLLYNREWLVIGGTSGPANSNVGLQLAGVNRVLVLNVLSTTQQNALTGVDGMLIVNSTTGKLNFRSGGSWHEVTST